MRVDVKAVLRAALRAALFGAAGATAYELQLLLPRDLPHATAAASFDGTVTARHLPRVTLRSDERTPVAIGEGTPPAVLVLGYTRCTDRCPLTLAALTRALEQAPRAHRIRALFVTTDPERDTPDVLHRYLGAWHHAVLGASATPAVVRDLEARLGASAGAREDHDTRLFVIDADGDVTAELPPESSVTELRTALSLRR
jgi:cytochrome oxidase Cu insertion factor (SCO1/SenC/PrrC family)